MIDDSNSITDFGIPMTKSTERYTVQRAGEYLVAAELSRRGFIATTFSGNAPSFDVIAIKDKKAVVLQVKTTSDISFPADLVEATTNENGEQYTHKKPLDTPDLVYVLVKLKDAKPASDEFYICTEKEFQDAQFEGHEEWLLGCEVPRKRPRKPNSSVVRVGISSLAKYKDNWGIISSKATF